MLKALKAPNLSEFKNPLDQARASAEAAGITPEDLANAIRKVRAEK